MFNNLSIMKVTDRNGIHQSHLHQEWCNHFHQSYVSHSYATLKFVHDTSFIWLPVFHADGEACPWPGGSPWRNPCRARWTRSLRGPSRRERCDVWVSRRLGKVLEYVFNISFNLDIFNRGRCTTTIWLAAHSTKS